MLCDAIEPMNEFNSQKNWVGTAFNAPLLPAFGLLFPRWFISSALVFCCLATAAGAQETALSLCCARGNDLESVLKRCGQRHARNDTPLKAIEAAAPGSAVLILADGYPEKTTPVSPEIFDLAARKNLRLYIEYPQTLPSLATGVPQTITWERAVVAADDFGAALPKNKILALHDCHYIPMSAPHPLLVIARVAGFDTAVYGLPKNSYPVLFEVPGRKLLVATTKLSCFISDRYAPAGDWRTIWQFILDKLDPDHVPHRLDWTPTVVPAFGQDEKLPRHFERRAFNAAGQWLAHSSLLVSPSRQSEVAQALSANQETTARPETGQPGDGSLGILEGYASGIFQGGKQMQRLPLRGDCNAESAMVFALDGLLNGHKQSTQIAKNLLDFIYFNSGMCKGARSDPKNPAFGLVGWGDISPLWLVANYGDDNASDMLGTMLVAASLKTDRWDEALAKALLANFRTTGKLGFRGDRIDLPDLEKNGWQYYRDAATVSYAPHFESYLWACDLWAYQQTGFRPLLDKATNAIAMTMKVYPTQWRWQNNLERARMLLCLSWLVRVEDTPKHRDWLKKIAGDLLNDQQPSGAIRERLGPVHGFFQALQSNEEYGTGETPLLQENGDPVTDQLYTTGFALLGLHEAVAATGDQHLRKAEDKLAEFLCRIQIRSEKVPWLNGWWFRAFDDRRWEYWASSADIGWGAWSLEAGWGQAWTAVTLGLREKKISFWEMTANSHISNSLQKWKTVMLEDHDHSGTASPEMTPH
jgi:hypothetical protein